MLIIIEFTEELNEEDQSLKNELEMLVERLKVLSLPSSSSYQSLILIQKQEPDTTLYRPALDAIKNFIKTSTSSMTAVPKPLKFLRPHYDELTEVYERWQAGSEKVGFYLCIRRKMLIPVGLPRRYTVCPRNDIRR